MGYVKSWAVVGGGRGGGGGGRGIGQQSVSIVGLVPLIRELGVMLPLTSRSEMWSRCPSKVRSDLGDYADVRTTPSDVTACCTREEG